ncbi:MAG: potassium transporter Kup [Thermoanaerobaculia bacterium]|nr:potassium transporter Kup [Thermoanaerobaculia bacterium]
MNGTPLALHAPRISTAGSRLGPLTLAALGVVYGDIGTSPLYAIRECFHGPHALAVTRGNVLGILSLVFWTLTIVVTLKYQVYVLRADNHGEGGILALMALVRGKVGGRWRAVTLALGLFGGALLYADGVLTPAISVLGAMEGLSVTAPALEGAIVPATLVILVGLFLFQRRGTAGVGAVFGPIMLVWFAVLAVLGIAGIAREPGVLAALDPSWAIRFFLDNGGAGFLVLGAVFLVATGGEALYADLGHFGPRPIRLGWFGFVGVALLANYFGQGALLLHEPSAAESPFFLLAPSVVRLPLLLLATMAAIIASQAIITGSFSLTRQAVQLGYLPRMQIVHTSATEIGQIYVPFVNWALLFATVGVVVAFGSSSHVAAAYGVALTATMFITTLLAFLVARRIWHWPLWLAAGLTALFLVPDVAFFAAALTKVPDGGWFPLALGGGVLVVMTTWGRGRELLAQALSTRNLPLEATIADLDRRKILRVEGTAVYLTSEASGTPIALLHNLKLNRLVHEQNVFLTVLVEEIPHVDAERRLEIQRLEPGFARVIARFGFLEDSDVPAVLALARDRGLEIDPKTVTYVLNRNVVQASARSPLPRWRQSLFAALVRNATTADEFFQLPPNRVLSVGMQVEV